MFKKVKNEIIFTCQNNFREIAKDELLSISNNGNFIEWLNDNCGRLKINNNYENFINDVYQKQIVFTRHTQPINFLIEMNNDANDLNNILKIKTQLMDLLNINNSVSIQIRINNKQLSFNKLDLLNILQDELKVFTIDNKDPEQIISIFITENNCFVGVSKTNLNLSKWSGGECRYSENNIVSRSEFKLLELFEYFKIDFTKYKKAIDLGCAPGGWSMALLEKHIKVIGIDPAEVDEKLKQYKNFTHFKETAEQFLKVNKDNFDLIVNDMKMDYDKSIKIVNSLIKYLNKDGLIIITIKLHKNDKNTINNIINGVKSNYNILFIKQLYYNRNEFTCVLTPNKIK